ncbi:MAG: FecR domain-containing protein [Pyrinomonadaceae bacterium]
MRKACKTFANLSLAVMFVVTCAAFAGAQNREEHFISARAGGVNFVSGDVTFKRAGKNAWQQLATTDELKSGDLVRTGADGRAEILLNPGSYLRLGENSEFELSDAVLDTLRLKLIAGSALLEAAGFDDADMAVAFDTPETHASIVRSGIYRFDVAAGTTELFVRKGRALIGRERTLVKEGMSAHVGATGTVEIAKFDKKQKDTLDLWGKERAQEIARVTQKLRFKQVNSALSQVPWDSFYRSNNLFGIWFYAASSRAGGCYTFLPFYPWVSPYGYSPDFMPVFGYLCGSCHRQYYNPHPYYPSGGGGMTTASGTTNTGSTPSASPGMSPGTSPGMSPGTSSGPGMRPDTGSRTFSLPHGGDSPAASPVSSPGGGRVQGVPRDH